MESTGAELSQRKLIAYLDSEGPAITLLYNWIKMCNPEYNPSIAVRHHRSDLTNQS